MAVVKLAGDAEYITLFDVQCYQQKILYLSICAGSIKTV